VRLADLNALEDDEAVRAFLRCCGSSQWARRMAAARPFASVEAMAVDADATWRALDRVGTGSKRSRRHPEIGAGGVGAAWSDQEQAGVAWRPGRRAAGWRPLTETTRARFGYIFIICQRQDRR